MDWLQDLIVTLERDLAKTEQSIAVWDEGRMRSRLNDTDTTESTKVMLREHRDHIEEALRIARRQQASS